MAVLVLREMLADAGEGVAFAVQAEGLVDVADTLRGRVLARDVGWGAEGVGVVYRSAAECAGGSWGERDGGRGRAYRWTVPA